MPRNFWYFPLEATAGRYTGQLGQHWMPAFFKEMFNENHWTWRVVTLNDDWKREECIHVGSVLDATRRGSTALGQCAKFLVHVATGAVSNDDIVFLQDFWTPGFESVLYALHLKGVRPRIYAMLHAQTVDEYDFTYGMRQWMRGVELGLSKAMTGIFVASTVHKDQLRVAGFDCPIHVVGLPLHAHSDPLIMNAAQIPQESMAPTVMWAARWNDEKNVDFMAAVADRYLTFNSDANFVVVTAVAENNLHPVYEQVLSKLVVKYARDGRFRIVAGCDKALYYDHLRRARAVLNTSLQDYVSWITMEAAVLGTPVVAPRFRSFPEIENSLPFSCRELRTYAAWNAQDAVACLYAATKDEQPYNGHLADKAFLSGRTEMAVMALESVVGDVQRIPAYGVNIWRQPQLCERLVNTACGIAGKPNLY